MKLWINFYELIPLVHPNSCYSRAPKAGALLKVDFEDGSLGYSDYHPWRELKNSSLFEKIQYIRSSRQSVYFQHSVDQAWRDAQFRYNNQSGFDLFHHIELSNHYLIPDIKNFSKIKLLELEAQGYRRFKVKMGRNLRSETLTLRKLCETCSKQTQFRLDFNESFKIKDFRVWLDKNENLLKHIEFIEDPIPFEASKWEYLSNKYPICLALDMAANP